MGFWMIRQLRSLTVLGTLVLGAATPSLIQADETGRDKAVTRVRGADDAPGLPKAPIDAKLPTVNEILDALPPGIPGKEPVAAPPPAAGLLPFEERALAAPGGDPYLKFKAGDEHLLNMETADGLFKFFVGGRLQIDGAWLSAGDRVQADTKKGGLGDLKDAVNFRRARFDFGGTLYKNIDFLMEFDFINTFNAEKGDGTILPANTPAPTDMWVTFKDVPLVGNVRIGNQKPPISFEHMTSSRFLNFMERSLAFDAFIENQNNGFEPGVAVFDQYFDKRLYASAGVFKNTRNVFGWNTGDGEYDVTGRVAFLPVWENNGEQLVHVGVGASHRDLDDGQERLRARLEVRNGPAVLHTIVNEVRMFGDSRDTVVPEFVVVNGRFTFQSEYHAAWVNNASIPTDKSAPVRNVGTPFFQGGYAEALCFLTDDHKTYDRGRFAFTRVTPRNNFRGFKCNEADGCDTGNTGCGGGGAWELGLRYSWLDLDNNGVRGGMSQDVTLGLNWYLNPYMKLQWNYTYLYRNAPNPANDGGVHAFGTRIAVDF